MTIREIDSSRAPLFTAGRLTDGRTPRWLARTADRLADLQSRGLRRILRPRSAMGDGLDYTFATNDYLCLSSHPRLIDAVSAVAAVEGVGAGSSRLIAGTLERHSALEARFAALKGAEKALLCPTGYMANVALLATLPQPGDLIILDRLCHASLIDGARFAAAVNRCRFQTYPHLNTEALVTELQLHSQRRPSGDIWIVTDSVFSMDGDIADLPALAAVRDRFEAALIVDEAHGTGVLGPRGAGLDEGHVADLAVSTASKALGSIGGIITGPAQAIDWLITAARPFLYTTAVPPTCVAAIDAALDVLENEPDRRQLLAEISRELRRRLRFNGWPVSNDPTPIVPLITGTVEQTLAMAERLRSANFWAPAIRPPTVASGASRIRLSVRCDVTDRQIERLINAVGEYSAKLAPAQRCL